MHANAERDQSHLSRNVLSLTRNSPVRSPFSSGGASKQYEWRPSIIRMRSTDSPAATSVRGYEWDSPATMTIRSASAHRCLGQYSIFTGRGKSFNTVILNDLPAGPVEVSPVPHAKTRAAADAASHHTTRGCTAGAAQPWRVEVSASSDRAKRAIRRAPEARPRTARCCRPRRARAAPPTSPASRSARRAPRSPTARRRLPSTTPHRRRGRPHRAVRRRQAGCRRRPTRHRAEPAPEPLPGRR